MTRLVPIGILIALLVLGAIWLFAQRSAPGPLTVDAPWWTADDRLVEVEGMTVRVRLEGAETAPPLVLIHGFSHSLESWDAWAGELSADYRVIRMDLPGHGLTGPDPRQRYSVAETVTFVSSLLDELDIDRAALIGNSLGGLVAWRFAAEEPERVERLVLLAPGGFSINGVTEEPVAVPMGVRFYLTQAPQPVIAAATQSLFGDASRMDPDMPARVHGLMRREGVGEAMVQRLEVFTLPDPRAELARVKAPTLIVWGGADIIVPPDHAARFVAAMPNATLAMFDDLGHVPHEEDPARTLVAVREFLDGD